MPAIRSRRIITKSTEPPVPATIWFEAGRITRVGAYEAVPSAPAGYPAGKTHEDVTDFGDLVIMPGIVDTHAHINEPGRTDWEGFRTATRAAAAGGITTVVDMPLNSIPATTTLSALRTKAASAEGQCTIDYGFWGGVIPGNAGELEAMIDAGVMGFKCFLCPSGVDEFPMATETDLRVAMPILARRGIPLLVHAEIESPVPGHAHGPAHGARDYAGYLESRPPSWEVDAIRLAIRLARETGCRTHIVHLSAADALDDLAAARATGVPITAETCPHYLAFAAEEIPAGETQFKCAPPIRSRANQALLWNAVRSGLIEFIVSDHSPCTPELKKREIGDFMGAWGGIAGLQFSFPVVWTGLRRLGGANLSDDLATIVRLMCEHTARFAGLAARKARLAPGFDADFVVWDPDAEVTVDPATVEHRHKLTPYAGRRLLGRVHSTYVRGVHVYRDGTFANAPTGTWLQRGPTST